MVESEGFFDDLPGRVYFGCAKLKLESRREEKYATQRHQTQWVVISLRTEAEQQELHWS